MDKESQNPEEKKGSSAANMWINPDAPDVPVESVERPERPTSVTLLGWGVLIIAALHLVRLVQTARQWELLSILPGVSPLYLAATGLGWGLAGLLVVYSLWSGKAFASRLTLIFGLAYTLYYWTDLIMMADAASGATESPALPFQAAATVFLLLFMILTLSRRKAITYFRRSL